MSEILCLIQSLEGACSCGKEHKTTIRDIQIGPGLVHHVGEILSANAFPKKLLLVADQNTLKAANGIANSLAGFDVAYKIYDELRVAEMKHVKELEALIFGQEIAVLSVGTGSVNDPCRLAAARQNKPLCIFATAPSMDGFSSYNAPIVADGFKITYPAKSPEVIIGDTEILARAPKELKSAGFGDMISKYIALVDWQVSALITGEYYCEKIAKLTRDAVDELMDMADSVTKNDTHVAGKIFESLLKTGVGMSFTQNSRPASGCEHIISHLMECVELRDHIIPNYHGDDVGVCTLEMLRFYNELAKKTEIQTQQDPANWDDVYNFYGNMAEDVKKINTPCPVLDDVDEAVLQAGWHKIVEIIKSVPSYETCRDAMVKAGCKITVQDIEKKQDFFDSCVYYSPYMRRRLTLLGLSRMIR